jgi:hypothetical protein
MRFESQNRKTEKELELLRRRNWGIENPAPNFRVIVGVMINPERFQQPQPIFARAASTTDK